MLKDFVKYKSKKDYYDRHNYCTSRSITPMSRIER